MPPFDLDAGDQRDRDDGPRPDSAEDSERARDLGGNASRPQATGEVATAGGTSRETAPGFGCGMVVLKPHRAAPFLGRHPWVFESAIARIEGDCRDGEIVELATDKRKFLARGILNRSSHLRVRLYAWDAAQPLDDSFWAAQLDRAIRLRDELGMNDPRGGCRLVFSEADGLSGLIVDRYADHLVVQVNALSIAVRLATIVRCLSERLRPASVIVRTEPAMLKAEAMTVPVGPAAGVPPTGPVFLEEHGLRYGIDLLSGQKTGFYLDQRDNRAAAARYLRGRSVLDLFCYSGGFSLCASRLGHAREVLGIDSSEKAIALARANATLNEVTNVRFEHEDAFRALEALRGVGRRFDAVILDPPKFARSRSSAADAIRAYHRINRLAVELLAAGGILVTCSCSGSVSREDFLQMLAAVAQKTGRGIRVLEHRGPSADHPLNPTCLESDYLKCLICAVD